MTDSQLLDLIIRTCELHINNESEEDEDGEDIDINDRFGGNMDDAYNGGLEDGRHEGFNDCAAYLLGII